MDKNDKPIYYTTKQTRNIINSASFIEKQEDHVTCDWIRLHLKGRKVKIKSTKKAYYYNSNAIIPSSGEKLYVYRKTRLMITEIGLKSLFDLRKEQLSLRKEHKRRSNNCKIIEPFGTNK